MSGDTPTTADPLVVDAADAARMIGISPSHYHALRATGRWGPEPIRLGRAVRFRVDELRDWVAAGCPSRSKWAAIWKGASNAK